MFTRPASTRRNRTLVQLPAIGVAVAMAAAFSPSASGDPGNSGDAPYRGKIVSLMNHMTLEQKVGQLFVIEVAGRDANTVSDLAKATNQRLFGVDTPAQAIAKYQPGGVIYYTTRNNDDNIGDPAQVATLSNGLQTAALAQPTKIPLQISVDQEGGALVARFGAPATQMPGNMALGAGRSVADATRSAEVIGSELAAVGVTQDYAPVSDVNINPNNPVIGIRSIGGDAKLVSDLAVAQIKGYRAGGVSSVAKHFPGHGDTGVDSHFGLPEVTHTLQQIHDIDLPPFKAAADAGVETIMTAHVVMPAIDPGVPATMSHKVLTGLLRNELGYKGLIVTDALDMAGAAATYPADVAPVKALQAGADQLLVPVQMDTAMGAVLNAVKTGAISKQRIDESVYRVLLHKYQRGIFQDPIVDVAAAPQIMGAPQHLADAQAITDRTTTLVKNDANLLPLAAGPRKVLVAGWGVGTTQTMATALTARGATTQVRESGTTPSQAAIDSAVAAAATSDLVVVSTNNAYAVNTATGLPTPAAVAQTKLVKALIATGKPVVVAAMRNPYDVASFPEAKTVVDTFGYTADQVESLVRVIFGEVNPAGKLPVSIPKADGSGELYPFGHGLGF
ncbi:putative beta-N-acetylhexosaminidase [Janibacter sp. HTCC2649]|uniref:glycoside hydrolase family 3 protein n=1 Tax=Janibacter sp. HTCC2649 TaxID=313589 RepID=UPI0000670E20|nr:glycoside hydrolase family 3 protein [Janibacter sp. HTCC2649]EAP97566.1 putative beta-N-acetylhexosaminidase [Janibacter sp. HTCC2649]